MDDFLCAFMALSLNAVTMKGIFSGPAHKLNELVLDDDGDGVGRMKRNREQKNRIAIGFCFNEIELSILLWRWRVRCCVFDMMKSRSR